MLRAGGKRGAIRVPIMPRQSRSFAPPHATGDALPPRERRLPPYLLRLHLCDSTPLILTTLSTYAARMMARKAAPAKDASTPRSAALYIAMPCCYACLFCRPALILSRHAMPAHLPFLIFHRPSFATHHTPRHIMSLLLLPFYRPHVGAAHDVTRTIKISAKRKRGGGGGWVM